MGHLAPIKPYSTPEDERHRNRINKIDTIGFILVCVVSLLGLITMVLAITNPELFTN